MIEIHVDAPEDEPGEIIVHDGGRGIPAETVEKLIDYSTRTSSRAAYASPSRGQQGNALQTLIAMPYALAGEDCETVVIESHGVEHRIAFATDPIRQTPRPVIERRPSLVKNGTRLTVLWPNSPRSNLDDAKRDFLQLADTFTWLNPHLSLSVTWDGERVFEAERTSLDWTRWRPSAPTSAHWYNEETLQRLIGAEVAYAEDHGLSQRPVRDFIADFRGLSSTAKTKAICDGLEPQPPVPGRRRDRSGAGRPVAGRHEGRRATGEAEGPRNHRSGASSQALRRRRRPGGQLRLPDERLRA